MRNYETQGSSDPKGIIAVVIGAAILGYLMLNSLATALGVDISAALSLVIGLVCTVGLLGAGFWSQANETWPLTVLNVLPLALATFVMGWSPALNQLGCIGPLDMCWEAKWWASSYAHYGVALAILIVGYGSVYLTRDKY